MCVIEVVISLLIRIAVISYRHSWLSSVKTPTEGKKSCWGHDRTTEKAYTTVLVLEKHARPTITWLWAGTRLIDPRNWRQTKYYCRGTGTLDIVPGILYEPLYNFCNLLCATITLLNRNSKNNSYRSCTFTFEFRASHWHCHSLEFLMSLSAVRGASTSSEPSGITEL